MSFSDELTMRERLREPFPPEQIGKLPRSAKRPELDYVGHAAVVDRLNRYAPDWTFTIDERFIADGQCWIAGTMTIGGVSRPEYGDGDDPKEAISNFIRRAAMRFGVALDLWSKEDLLTVSEDPGEANTRTGTRETGASTGASSTKAPSDPPTTSAASKGSAAAKSGEVGPSSNPGGGEDRPTSSGDLVPHVHGPWSPAPRAGFVICQGTLPSGRPCGFAEKASVAAHA